MPRRYPARPLRYPEALCTPIDAEEKRWLRQELMHLKERWMYADTEGRTGTPRQHCKGGGAGEVVFFATTLFQPYIHKDTLPLFSRALLCMHNCILSQWKEQLPAADKEALLYIARTLWRNGWLRRQAREFCYFLGQPYTQFLETDEVPEY